MFWKAKEKRTFFLDHPLTYQHLSSSITAYHQLSSSITASHHQLSSSITAYHHQHTYHHKSPTTRKYILLYVYPKLSPFPPSYPRLSNYPGLALAIHDYSYLFKNILKYPELSLRYPQLYSVSINYRRLFLAIPGSP